MAAINPTMNWYVRSGGNALNGAGYDSTVSGAVTNYADQDAAKFTNTDIVTNGTTTVTSATGGFTGTAGNVLRIVGDNYYVVTVVNSNTNVTVHTATANGGGGLTASLGGAAININTFSNGGGGTAPPITPGPVVAGNTINLRGGGTDDPSSVTFTALDYLTFAAGDNTNGVIHWVGYNGRPCIGSLNSMSHYQMSFHRFTNCKFLSPAGGGGAYITLGMVNSTGNTTFDNCYVDANGNDCIGIEASNAINCRIKNTGGGAAGTDGRAGILSIQYNSVILGCRIRDWRGSGIYGGNMNTVNNNIITGCGKHGISIQVSAASSYGNDIINNTIDSCAGDGINLGDASTIGNLTLMNNIISNNTGTGINCTVGSTALNDRIIAGRFDYNTVYNNGTPRANCSAGTHDDALNPTFTATGSDDYSVGTNEKATAFPGTYLT